MAAKRLGPQEVKATVFRAAAIERWKDAQSLHDAGRFQVAIYLCGYSLECELKYRVCASRRQGRMVEREAKNLGHDLFRILAAAGLVQTLSRERDLFSAFHDINGMWSTEMRYSGRVGSSGESQRFLRDSRALISWLRTGSRA